MLVVCIGVQREPLESEVLDILSHVHFLPEVSVLTTIVTTTNAQAALASFFNFVFGSIPCNISMRRVAFVANNATTITSIMPVVIFGRVEELYKQRPVEFLAFPGS